jgi:hypothetical protein
MSEPKLKTISINPDIFSGFGGSSNTRKKKPEKPLKIKAPVQKSDKTRKKEILQRIRANQEKQYKTLFNEKENKPDTVETVFNNEFDESVKFMESVVENTEKANLNKTIKNLAPMMMTGEPNKPQSLLFHEDPTISNISEPLTNLIDTIDSSVVRQMGNPINNYMSNPVVTPYKIQPPPPQYGCLKGGMMPTYRNYTMKSGVSMPSTLSMPYPQQQQRMPHQQQMSQSLSTSKPGGGSALTPAPNNIVGRIRTPDEINEMKKLREIKIEDSKNKPKKIPKKVRKITKRTFRVGRDKYKPAVGVLLPNKTIKNNVTTQTYMLKQTPIAEVRKYLLKTGFIKVGSAAPSDVLRKIYESIKLIDGDVKNHNPDNLLYNFFNDTAK